MFAKNLSNEQLIMCYTEIQKELKIAYMSRKNYSSDSCKNVYEMVHGFKCDKLNFSMLKDIDDIVKEEIAKRFMKGNVNCNAS